jgi:phosphoribosylaminoimidazole (AIR) synthetase
LGALFDRKAAGSDRAAMARNVTCALGTVAVVTPAAVAFDIAALEATGERVHRIGRIVARAGDEPGMRRLQTQKQWLG